MSDDQVNLVVQHLCEQLHLALRLKDSEAHPPNAKDIGFDPASVRTVLLTGSRLAGVTIHHEAAAGRAKSRRGPVNAKRGTEAPRQCLSWDQKATFLLTAGLAQGHLINTISDHRGMSVFVRIPDLRRLP